MLDHETLNPIVESSARIIRMDYPGLDGSDISQEMWMWVYANGSKVKEYLSEGSEGTRLLKYRLRSIGHRFAIREMAFENGVEYEDIHVYTTGQIRELLLDVFDYRDWQSSQTFYDDMPKAKAATNMTGDRISMLADVKSALDKLDEDHYNVLVWIFKLCWTYDELGQYLGISPNAARKRTERAIGKIRKILMGIAENTEIEGPDFAGTRRAVSNATAMSYQSNMWNG